MLNSVIVEPFNSNPFAQIPCSQKSHAPKNPVFPKIPCSPKSLAPQKSRVPKNPVFPKIPCSQKSHAPQKSRVPKMIFHGTTKINKYIVPLSVN